MLFALIALFHSPAMADSPLTSTPFYEAYQDIPQVNNAQGTAMNDWIFEFLTDSNKPLDQKVAVINAMEWNFNGMTNGRKFIDLLAEKLKKKPGKLKIKHLTAHELLCLGYMLAMDDYFDLGPAAKKGGQLETAPALKLLGKAAAMEPDDFTVQIIFALAKAQNVSAKNWCNIFMLVQNVAASGLTPNMRKDAVDIIMDYIGIYREYCVKDEVKKTAVKLSPLKVIAIKKGAYGVVLSPDGAVAVTHNGNEEAVRLWDTDTGTQIAVLDNGKFTDRHVFSPDGKWLLVSDWTPQVIIYAATGYQPVKILKFPSRVLGIAVNASAKQIAFGMFDGVIQVYCLETWKVVKTFTAHKKYVASAVFSKDGKHLLTGSYDQTVKVWSVGKDYALEHAWKDFTDGTFAGYLPGDKNILVRDYDGNVNILDSDTGKVAWKTDLPFTVHDAAVDPSGKLLAVSTETGAVYLWDWKAAVGPLIFKAHDDQVGGVAFTPDGGKLLTAGMDDGLQFWDVAELKKKLQSSGKKGKEKGKTKKTEKRN